MAFPDLKLSNILNKFSLWNHFMDRKQVAFYRQFIGKHKLFFDVGANKGRKTKIFRSLGIKVVAIEPQKACLAILKKKFLTDPMVTIVPKGLGNKPGILALNKSSGSDFIATFAEHWKSGRFKDFRYDQKESVKITTLKALIRTFGLPDFCKIDVEGYELQVLQGLRSKIPCLNFEFTSEFFPKTIKCLEQLQKIGFRRYNFVAGENPSFALSKWVDQTDLIKYLEKTMAKSADLWGDIYAK